MNERTRDGLLTAIALIALVAIALAKSRAHHAVANSIFSTYDNGRNGYSALYEVLRNAGTPTRRLRTSLSRFDDAGTLVVSDNDGDPAGIALNKADSSALQRFVSRGGRLVVLASSFAGGRDVVPHVPRTADADIAIANASPALRAQTGVASVAAPAEAAFLHAPHVASVLTGGDATSVAIEYAVGKGSVVASTSPQSFGNAWLLRRDNLRFAYAVLAGHGPVTFDEYIHGYDDDLSFWQAVPESVKAGLALAAIIVFVALIGANVPFAPPVPLDDPDERTSAAYVEAMASLLRRAHARADAIAALARHARRATSQQRLEAAAELDRLTAGPLNDAALRRAAWLEYQLRKERG